MKKYFSLVLVYSLFSFVTAAQSDSSFIITSDSVKLFVQRSGKGQPVLFIHGGPGSHSGYFQYCGGNVFEKDVEMIYLDQRGCGRSSNAANNNYSLERMIRDFEEVREKLGIQQWIIMPHSFGGIMATEYATRFPASIKAMIYLNCTISIDHSAKSGLQKIVSLLKENDVAYADLLNDSIPLLQRWGNAFGRMQDKPFFYSLMFDSKKNFDYHDSVTQRVATHWDFGQKVWSYPEYFKDYSTATKSIQQPVLIISGTRDYTIGLDHPELMQFPKKQIRYIPGGHALYMEHGEELYGVVKEFLHKL